MPQFCLGTNDDVERNSKLSFTPVWYNICSLRATPHARRRYAPCFGAPKRSRSNLRRRPLKRFLQIRLGLNIERSFFMNLILIIFLISYIVGIIAISLRLRDIIKNPDKYEDLELEARAADKVKNTKYCNFFKSLSHQYACILFIPSFILFGLLSYLALRLIHKIMAGESELIMLGGTIAGLIPALFLGIELIFTIAYFIKTPFFAIAIDDACCSGGRLRNIKVNFICLLVSFVLLFPFYSLSANCYVHFDDEGINSSKYFELGETYTPYEDVLHAKVWMN